MNTEKQISAIHHITAVASSAADNLAFYRNILGLPLVKKTVNFDDPYTYHLYYGDEQGRPGTIMTFFPWKGAPRGTLGAGQTSTTAFSVPEGSLGFWHERLQSSGLPVERPRSRFDEEVLAFADPDGLRLELVAHERARAGARALGAPRGRAEHRPRRGAAARDHHQERSPDGGDHAAVAAQATSVGAGRIRDLPDQPSKGRGQGHPAIAGRDRRRR